MILVYFMDGLKIEMAKKYMPFLASLNKKPLKSEFGYSCACHATMYTGRYIDEHNTWFVWKRGNNSPYKWVNKIPFMKYFNLLPLKMAVTKVTRMFCKNTSFPGIPMMVNLPLKYWGEFEPCENKFWDDDDYLPGINTIFKTLKNNNIPNRSVGFSRGGDAFSDESNVDYEKEEFIYYFLGEVDHFMHQYGENGTEAIEYLKKTDDFIKMTYEKALSTGKEVTIICYSDHGHIDVENKIDPNKYFKTFGFNINKYIHLTESTFLRFWFRNDKEREEVMKVISDMQKNGIGFIMDDKIQKKYHLQFKSDEHGELVFHLNAPNVFTNTIWGFGRKTTKSMHGYLPELEKHYGVFASNKALSDKDFIYLTDIFPTLLNELGLKKDETMPGECVLSGEKVTYE